MATSSKFHPIREKLQGRNIYLVGMMGSGKSTTADLLAKRLAYSFIDTDALIEKLVGMTISQFFTKEGEGNFRKIEAQVLQTIGQRHSLVVATGGGIVTSPKNWGVLHQGIVVWLDPGREQLLARLQDESEKRPLLKGANTANKLDGILSERKPFYSEADLHQVIGNETKEEVAENILEDLASTIKSSEDLTELRTIEE